MKFYDWQEKIINHKGNITIRGGRQTGKSWSVAKRIVELANLYPGSRHLIIAASERQENYLLDKVKELLGKSYKFRGRATLKHLPLKNGTDILKFPVGMTGIYIEGLSSIDFLYADEAIHIPRKVWDSIIPMLAEPRKRGLGWITLLSSTRGRPKGYFFDSFKSDDFEKIIIRAEDCEHIDKPFLEQEKKRLGERFYNVIYNGEFDEYAHKYFSPEIVMKAIKIPFFSLKDIDKEGNYYLGIDPARFGKSKAAFAVAKLELKEKIKIVHGEEYPKTSMVDLMKRTEQLDIIFKRLRMIFIDDGGVGGGLVDILENKFKWRIRPLNNKIAVGKDKILKEYLYSNVQRLLEEEKLEIVNDKIIIDGLLNAEFDNDGGIIGTDMSEAIVRACWCVKEKNIKPFIISFK